jgi:SAM-dependent methyltransferase
MSLAVPAARPAPPLAPPPGTAASSLGAALDAALDACQRRLAPATARAALDALVADLAQLRGRTPPDAWRAAVTALRAGDRPHPLLERLAEDPYTAAALAKPRGYAGDAHTLDFVYGRRALGPDVPALGRALHAVTTGVPVAEAVRARLAHVAEAVHDAVAGAARPDAVVVSVACGHLRELHAVPAERLARATVVAVDQDPVTLAALPALHPSRPVTPVRARVRDLIAGAAARDAIPEADLIYAAGLYDYLDDPAAAALTRTLAARLRPGGTLLVANLTPVVDEAAFMEAVMDWWMVYRDAAALARAGAAAGDPALAVDSYTVAEGRVACVRVTRDATRDATGSASRASAGPA